MKIFWEVVEYGRAPRWQVSYMNDEGDGVIARCYTEEDAKKVALALNRLESDLHRGE